MTLFKAKKLAEYKKRFGKQCQTFTDEEFELFLSETIDATLNEVEKKVREIPALTDAQVIQIVRVLKVLQELRK